MPPVPPWRWNLWGPWPPDALSPQIREAEVRSLAEQLSKQRPWLSAEENWYAAERAILQKPWRPWLIRFSGEKERSGWDWAELSLKVSVPVLILGLTTAYSIISENRRVKISITENERLDKIAQIKRESDVLTGFIKEMQPLILDQAFESTTPETGIRGVARGLTLAALSQIRSPDNKGFIIRFLLDSGLNEPAGRLFNLGGSKLAEASLTGANLGKARLSAADLRSANLEFSMLRGATFTRANLSRAKLYRADLSEANLYRANLVEADLRQANLTEAKLIGASLRNAVISEADLTKANLHMADFEEAFLREANLYRADLSKSRFRKAYLIQANLSGANLAEADLQRADLRRANLSGANLSRAHLAVAYFRGANLSGANLRGACLFRANLSRANLRGADLSGANIANAKFESTVCPNGSKTNSGCKIPPPIPSANSADYCAESY
jgi:uncharacterized protein YjbI with pentapeptide repeats